MTHLDTSNTTFGQKKGRESNWQFDSRPLKVGNRLDFLVCRWHATYRWKVLIRATTLLQTSSQSEVCTQSCGPPKSRESQLWEFWDSHLRVLGQNDIWALVTWPSTKYIIRVQLPPSLVCGDSCESKFARGSFQHQKCFSYTLTNLLFGFVLDSVK